jgi:DNA replication protein DnaC
MSDQLPPTDPTLPMLLRQLKLPSFEQHQEELGRKAERDGWRHQEYLRHLAEMELGERRGRRIQRLLKSSELPSDKTLGTLKQELLPAKVRRQLPALCAGDFVKRAENVLAFGLPGRGKTHLACAIGHELVQRGYQVLFVSACMLVQRLLVAKQNLALERELGQLDIFDAVIMDDIGYIQQSRDEMEVLFTFLAERYERRSVLITSNLVFSQWDRIFKDAMTTAAAIDRVVHHSIILEMTGPSIREEAAKERAVTKNQASPAQASRAPEPETSRERPQATDMEAAEHPALTADAPNTSRRDEPESLSTTCRSPPDPLGAQLSHREEEHTKTEPSTTTTTTTKKRTSRS